MNDVENEPDENEVEGIADERLVHALLLHLLDEQALDGRERRVQRAVHAIRRPPVLKPVDAGATVPSRAVRMRAWPRRVLAAAAVLVVAATIWTLTSSPTTAMASVDEIINALGRPGDRTFHIRMEELPEPPGRRPADDHGNVPRPGLNDATLYLRDGRQYVLVRHDPNGGVIYDGFDGRQSWRVRRGVVAETQQGLGAGGIPMPPIMADVPFSDLHGTLARVQKGYTVERLDRAMLPGRGEQLRYVQVRRDSREVKGPQTIEIWADLKTAMPRRIVFDRAKLQGSHAPCRVTLDLRSEDLLPAAWFVAESHTAGASTLPGTSRPRTP